MKEDISYGNVIHNSYISVYHNHHLDIAIKELGHLLERCGLTHPEVSSVVFVGISCLFPSIIEVTNDTTKIH
jgi:hypothetical protein